MCVYVCMLCVSFDKIFRHYLSRHIFSKFFTGKNDLFTIPINLFYCTCTFHIILFTFSNSITFFQTTPVSQSISAGEYISGHVRSLVFTGAIINFNFYFTYFTVHHHHSHASNQSLLSMTLLHFLSIFYLSCIHQVPSVLQIPDSTLPFQTRLVKKITAFSPHSIFSTDQLLKKLDESGVKVSSIPNDLLFSTIRESVLQMEVMFGRRTLRLLIWLMYNKRPVAMLAILLASTSTTRSF